EVAPPATENGAEGAVLRALGAPPQRCDLAAQAIQTFLRHEGFVPVHHEPPSSQLATARTTAKVKAHEVTIRLTRYRSGPSRARISARTLASSRAATASSLSRRVGSSRRSSTWLSRSVASSRRSSSACDISFSIGHRRLLMNVGYL